VVVTGVLATLGVVMTAYLFANAREEQATGRFGAGIH